MASALALLPLSLLLTVSPPEMAEQEAQLAAHLARPGWRAERLRRSPGLTILNVAAHPDDEDGASLTTLGHHYAYRTHILYTTRGEGGQNEIGDALGDALGVIRSQECHAAATAYGARISFLNALDFGFSKTAEETEARWGREEMVQRTVAELRRLAPDLVLTHHTPIEGHGHHRATSRLLREAIARMSAAGDAAPVLLERVREPTPTSVALDSGLPAPGLPWTYAGWAHVALRRHRSQGMGLAEIPEGPAVKWYTVVAETATASRVTAWRRETDPWSPAAVGRLIGVDGDPAEPSRVGREAVARRWDAGLRIQVDPGPAWVRVGDDPFRITLRAPDLIGVEVVAAPAGFDVLGPQPGSPGSATLTLRATAGATWPEDVFVRNRRTVADSLTCDVAYPGAVTERVRIALPARRPVALLRLAPPRPARAGERVRLTARWWGDATGLTFRTDPPVPVPLGWGDGDPHGLAGQRLTLELPAAPAGQTLRIGWFHPHTSGSTRIPTLDVRIPSRPRVGFVEGVDGSTGPALELAGCEVQALTAHDLREGDLSRFPVILLDVRAYLVREDLRAANSRLLDYARNGGHLVVQYHKTFEWNRDHEPWSPLALRLGRNRVVDETATVVPGAPDHRFWSFPHLLTAADWDGWVQERGLYFPASWDPAFTSLVRVADPGEAPLDGAILTARVGAGAYTYTSLVWYRQLRAGVPGAFRGFLNLLFWPYADTAD